MGAFPERVQPAHKSSCSQKVHMDSISPISEAIKRAMVFLLTTIMMQKAQQHGSSNICQSMQTPEPTVTLYSRVIDIIVMPHNIADVAECDQPHQQYHGILPSQFKHNKTFR